MTEPQPDAGDARPALLSAFCFLFFIQLLTIWIESIYRLSLIELSPGKELLGLVFMLAPLVALFAGRGAPRWLFVGSLVVMFVARALCPLLEGTTLILSLIHISEPTRLLSISYAVFCLKKKKHTNT